MRKIILAPMAGITNLPFRLICKKHGAGMVSTEMVSCEALIRGNKITERMLQTVKEEKPVSIQIFGNHPNKMAKAATLVESRANVIDINFGCPAVDIMAQGSGSALLKTPSKIEDIVRAVVKAVKKPVTAKIRVSKNIVKIAKLIENAGAERITVHGRTPAQGYSGTADLSAIKSVKDSVSIPVTGNGDIWDENAALRMFEETGCDSIMIGRAAMNEPFIFKRVSYFLRTKKLMKKQDLKKKSLELFEYFKLAEKYDLVDLHDFRSRAQDFLKGFPGSTTFRNQINQAGSMNSLSSTIKSFARQVGG